jgi:molybdate transport system substrate-binding protein
VNHSSSVDQPLAKSALFAPTNNPLLRWPFATLVLFLLGALTVVACSSGASEDTVVVFAAASLTDAFDELAADYERTNPGEQVDLRFGGSSRLLSQLEDGAPASVFVSADETTMDQAIARGVTVGAAEPIATNRVAVIVPEGNPRSLVDAADLTGSPLIIAACAVEVPCGRAAEAYLDDLDLLDEVTITTREPNVRAVVTRVTTGEVDAGLVYASDAAQLDRNQTLAEGLDAGSVTLMAATTNDSAIARSFVDYLRSEDARTLLVRWGFGEVGDL